MDKVLAFSILSASPADVAAGVGGSWTRLSWRRSAGDHADPARANKEEQASRSHDDRARARGGTSHSSPRFAPEFDGIDCFETIVSR